MTGANGLAYLVLADPLEDLLGLSPPPTTVGTVWIVAQAVVVGAFAELQLVGLRRGAG